jgi:hypothetical protein
MARKSRSGWRYGIGYELKGRPAEKKKDRLYSKETVSYQEYMQGHSSDKDKAHKPESVNTEDLLERGGGIPSQRSKPQNTRGRSYGKSNQPCNDSKSTSWELNYDEAVLLYKNREFYEPLESGAREPTTEAEAHFVEVCRGL